MWVDGATGAMQHATCNDLKKSGVCILIRQLCKHHAVVLITSTLGGTIESISLVKIVLFYFWVRLGGGLVGFLGSFYLHWISVVCLFEGFFFLILFTVDQLVSFVSFIFVFSRSLWSVFSFIFYFFWLLVCWVDHFVCCGSNGFSLNEFSPYLVKFIFKKIISDVHF